ncbi:T9SS C-terminal target domain-containing protein [Lutibacter sp. HS1-25]|uniref:T9SS type A sorting domain-containing protein n=1 Tax=Lutibacter sp. HS1-25 TaxID=2485000 RepID=UPI001012026C|nr:T9SS type A sorting domain-containing protein [Lutibacter sp. HS1-25]RXP44325.1 T9SS C-terminal target domain-containing protein [Lutibacter sp. HS1-25]
MKKLSLTISFFLITIAFVQGQTVKNVTTDGTTPNWLGYANVFQTNGTSWEFGSFWGLSDLKTIFSGNTITVKPNFNTWKSSDPYWVTPDGKANKVFAGNTFIQKDKTTGDYIDKSWFTDGTTNVTVNFYVNVDSFDFPVGYKVEAFILVFNEDYSYNSPYTQEITGPGSYVVTFPAANNALTDAHIQYGLRVTGLIVNPTLESSIGGMQTSPSTLGVDDEILNNSIKMYPNPVTDILHVSSQLKEIQKIEIFSMLGSKMMEVKTNFNSINMKDLPSGIYLLHIYSEKGTAVRELIKQ